MVIARSNILYKDYLNYLLRAIMKKTIFKVFIIVSIVAFIVLGVNLGITLSKNDEVKFAMILPLIVLVAIYIFYVSLYIGMSAKQYKRAKDAFQEVTDYVFLNNKFVIAKAGTTKGLDVFYEKITEIVETGKRVYFFIASDKSFMMKKNEFIKGDIKELREILNEHCPHARKKFRK